MLWVKDEIFKVPRVLTVVLVLVCKSLLLGPFAK